MHSPTDMLAATGVILDEQALIADMQGKDPLAWYTDQLKYITSPTLQAEADADLKVPYMFVDIVGGQAMVLFNPV